MEETKKVLMIPYIVHEGARARDERTIRRLVAVIILSLVLLVVTNLAWLYVWSQSDYGEETRTFAVDLDADDGGNANYIGQDGDINNGEDSSD